MTILSPFVWGLVIAYLLCPLMRTYQRVLFMPLGRKLFAKKQDCEKKVFKFARTMSVILAIATMLAVIAAVIWLIVPRVIESIRLIVVNSSDYINAAYGWIDRLLSGFPEVEKSISETYGNMSQGFFEWLRSTILPRLEGIITNVTSGAYYLLKGIYNVFIGMIVSVYVLYSKERVGAHAKKLLYCVFSLEASERIIKALHFVDDVFIGFLTGKILDSAIIGVLCYVVCAILGMPFALLVSVIVGITNIIPFFGPFIGAVPSTLIIVLAEPVKGLIFIIFIFILQQFDGNVLGPKILGSSVGINGFWVMFSIILGAGLFGFVGMLLGVPVFVIIYTGLRMLADRKLERSGLETDGEYYGKISYIDPETGEPVYKAPPEQKPQRRKRPGKRAKRSNLDMLLHLGKKTSGNGKAVPGQDEKKGGN